MKYLFLHTQGVRHSKIFTVATVDENGVVCGKSSGSAKIIAIASNGVKAECTVNVKVPCVVLFLDKNQIDLYKGETSQIVATLSPIDSTDGIRWSSSNSDIVYVSEGSIVARGVGEAVVRATTDSGIVESCTITVKQKLDSFRFYGIVNKKYTGRDISQNVRITDGNVVLKKNEDYVVSYSNNREVGTATVSAKGINNYEGVIATSFEISPIIHKVTFVSNGKIVDIQRIPNGDAAKEPDISRRSYIFTGWSDEFDEVTHDIVVNAKWTKVKVSKASILSITNIKTKKMLVKWKKLSGVKGYEIQYSTSENMKNAKKILSSGNSKKISNLKKRKYYVQVRAYKYDSQKNRIYGKWSNKKIVKISK